MTFDSDPSRAAQHPRRVATLIAWLVVGAVACTPPAPEQSIDFKVPVFAREIETGVVEDRVVCTGSLRAPEAVALRAETAGALALGKHSSGRQIAEGDRIEAGTVIAEITGDDVKLAARTESTYQRYQTNKRDYESKKRLYDDGLLSETELRQIEATLADSKVEWERSQLTINRSRLVSPISGVVLRLARDEDNLPVANGQLVTQGYVVAQIAPTGSLIADVDLIGSDLARVRNGLRARVRYHAWNEERFPGRVIRLAPTLDPMTRTLRAEVQVDNRGRKLRPGMFVEVTIVADRRENVPVVPREAVTERGGSKVVFILDANGQRVQRRDVVLGLGDDETVEIRKGVEPGEKVVVRGLETLTDDTRVRSTGA